MDNSYKQIQIEPEEMIAYDRSFNEYPKYTTQLMNIANRNSQATRSSIVGQLSELIKEFHGTTYDEWQRWYNRKHPKAISRAVKRLSNGILKLKQAINSIDNEMIELWLRDLILSKSYVGLKHQETIIRAIAKIKHLPYRLATLKEESHGIDGYIGREPVSIKPETYNQSPIAYDNISVRIVYYRKEFNKLIVSYNF